MPQEFYFYKCTWFERDPKNIARVASCMQELRNPTFEGLIQVIENHEQAHRDGHIKLNLQTAQEARKKWKELWG